MSENILFKCPYCGGYHFNVTNDMKLICTSVIKDNKVVGCGWKGVIGRCDHVWGTSQKLCHSHPLTTGTASYEAICIKCGHKPSHYISEEKDG